MRTITRLFDYQTTLAKIVNKLTKTIQLENKLTNIKERCLQIAEIYDIPKEIFFEKLGISYGSFKGEAKKTPVNSQFLENLLTNYPNISPDWLLTGTGKIFRNTVSQSIDGNHNIQANGDVKIDESTIKLKEKISYLENQVCFLTEQVKEKDNQINTLLSIISSK